MNERSSTTPAAGVDADLLPLVELWGLEPGFWPADGGAFRTAGREALLAALRALGALDEGDDLDEAARRRQAELTARILDPVTVVRADVDDSVLLRAPAEWRDVSLQAHLEAEDGSADREWAAPLTPETWTSPSPTAPGWPARDGLPGPLARLPLPHPLTPGYWTLRVRGAGRSVTSRVIATPGSAWTPSPPRRGWGAFLPLHALRTERSRGTGDFSDLERLLDWLGGLGAEWLGTLPLFPVFLDQPYDPSPYAPVSRRMWSELFIDPARAPELDRSADACALLSNATFRAEAARVREVGDVDYRSSAALVRRALEPLSSTFFADAPHAEARLAALGPDRATVERYARFRGQRDADADRSDMGTATRYHLYAQVLAREQIDQLTRREGTFTGLYLDLPLGTHPDGFDRAEDPELYAPATSVGAPPDPFFDQGQNWGFPPMDPHRLRERGHRPWADAFAHLARAARAVRIDHVMGLHRLFWIPADVSATDGVYVRYPAHELHAVLAVESHRAGIEVVGEDLGTVPDEVRAALDAGSVRRMYVVPFHLERDWTDPAPADGPPPPLEPVPPGAVASLGTHDMAPFAAWWSERVRARTGDATPPSPEQLEDVRQRLLDALAESPARMVLIDLEDLWLEHRPQNVPGTASDANWRRKAARSLDEIRASTTLVDSLVRIDRIRRAAEEPRPT